MACSRYTVDVLYNLEINAFNPDNGKICHLSLLIRTVGLGNIGIPHTQQEPQGPWLMWSSSGQTVVDVEQLTLTGNMPHICAKHVPYIGNTLTLHLIKVPS